jgi:hypothetical protein
VLLRGLTVSDHQPAPTQRDTYRAAACSGKISFRSHAMAQMVASRGSRSERSRQVYHCPFCHQFHLGRRPITARQQRRRARQADEE